MPHWTVGPGAASRGPPHPLDTSSVRPNPEKGAQTQKVLHAYAWSQTMVSEGARPWGKGRSEFAKYMKLRCRKDRLIELGATQALTNLTGDHTSTLKTCGYIRIVLRVLGQQQFEFLMEEGF